MINENAVASGNVEPRQPNTIDDDDDPFGEIPFLFTHMVNGTGGIFIERSGIIFRKANHHHRHPVNVLHKSPNRILLRRRIASDGK